MSLTSQARVLTNRQVGVGRTIERLQLARELEDKGDYENAQKALKSFWDGVGDDPVITPGDDVETSAEITLRCGTLTGWIGSSRQIKGSQELAKDLITRAITLFESIGEKERAGDASVDLAICYFREGSLNEARTILDETLTRATDMALRARALLNKGIVQTWSARLRDAIEPLIQARDLYNEIRNLTGAGRAHFNLAIAYKKQGEAERNEEFSELALEEYSAACNCYEQAGHIRHLAPVENNFGSLLLSMGRAAEARAHLERAFQLYRQLSDSGRVAQVNETRARVEIALGNYPQAERLADGAVFMLERGGEQLFLAEALRTHAVALARLNRKDAARQKLERAVKVSEEAGDIEAAGLAYLIIAEELGEELTCADRISCCLRAGELLRRAQSDEIKNRVLEAALAAMTRDEQKGEDSLTGGTFDEEVLRFERALIRTALYKGNRSVTAAAHILGISHQRLSDMLDEGGRHNAINGERTQKRARLRSLITKPQARR
jgi:tetratricopeptide (TPR) repeat protein